MTLPDNIRVCLAGPEDRDQVRALWREAFPEDAPTFVDWYFNHVYRPEHTLGVYAGGGGLSFLQCNPYTLTLLSRPVQTAAVAGVSTWPHHRRKGYAGRLMNESVHLLRAMGCAAAFLYPFDHGFYRPYGYETAMNRVEMVVRRQECPPGDSVLMDTDDAGVLTPLYDAFAEHYPVMAVRDAITMERSLAQQRCDGGRCALYLPRGKANGYVFYHVSGEELSLDEWALADRRDLDGLMGALFTRFPRVQTLRGYAPVDMAAFSRCAASAPPAPYVMLRVIDAAAFFEGARVAGVPQANVAFKDALCPWNRCTLAIGSQDGRLTARKTAEPADFRLSGAAIIRFLWGNTPPEDLLREGTVTGDAGRFLSWAYALMQPTAFLWENF